MQTTALVKVNISLKIFNIPVKVNTHFENSKK